MSVFDPIVRDIRRKFTGNHKLKVRSGNGNKFVTIDQAQFDHWSDHILGDFVARHYAPFDLAKLRMIVLGSSGVENFSLRLPLVAEEGLYYPCNDVPREVQRFIKVLEKLSPKLNEQPVDYFCRYSKQHVLFINVCLSSDTQVWANVVCSIWFINEVLLRARKLTNHKVAILDMRQPMHIHLEDIHDVALFKHLTNFDKSSVNPSHCQTDQAFKIEHSGCRFISKFVTSNEMHLFMALAELHNHNVYKIDRLYVSEEILDFEIVEKLTELDLEPKLNRIASINDDYLNIVNEIAKNQTFQRSLRKIAIFHTEIGRTHEDENFRLFLYEKYQFNQEKYEFILNEILNYLSDESATQTHEWMRYITEYKFDQWNRDIRMFIEENCQFSLDNLKAILIGSHAFNDQIVTQNAQIKSPESLPNSVSDFHSLLDEINTKFTMRSLNELESNHIYDYCAKLVKQNGFLFLNQILSAYKFNDIHTACTIELVNRLLGKRKENGQKPLVVVDMGTRGRFDLIKSEYCYHHIVQLGETKKDLDQNQIIAECLNGLLQNGFHLNHIYLNEKYFKGDRTEKSLIQLDYFISCQLRKRNSVNTLRLLLTVTLKNQWLVSKINLRNKKTFIYAMLTKIPQLKQSRVDANLFVSTNVQLQMYYVFFSAEDDSEALIFSNQQNLIDNFCQNYSEFIINYTTNFTQFMGIQIKFEKNRFLLHQIDLIENLAQYGIDLQNISAKKPIAYSNDILNLDKHTDIIENPKKICEFLQQLHDVAIKTRPDICAPVAILNNYANNPSEKLWELTCQIGRYLLSTKNSKLSFEIEGDFTGFTDGSGLPTKRINEEPQTNNRNRNTSQSSNSETTKSKNQNQPKSAKPNGKVDKSQTGYFLKLYGNCPIAWISEHQNVNSSQTVRIECLGVLSEIAELITMQRLMNELGVSFDCRPCTIYVDNTNMHDSPSLSPFNEALKHLIDTNRIKFNYKSSANNIADYFTKVMDNVKFENVRNNVCLVDESTDLHANN